MKRVEAMWLWINSITLIIFGAIAFVPLAGIRAMVCPVDPLVLIVERMISTTVALGVGTIFFFIWMFSNEIVTFMMGRCT